MRWATTGIVSARKRVNGGNDLMRRRAAGGGSVRRRTSGRPVPLLPSNHAGGGFSTMRRSVAL